MNGPYSRNSQWPVSTTQSILRETPSLTWLRTDFLLYFTTLETYREEVAIKPPGETILSAWSDNEIEAFDSKFDSNALPGSALTEVALDPGFLKMGKILTKVELQLYIVPLLYRVGL